MQCQTQSDELFDEDKKAPIKPKQKPVEKKKSYLDEQWELSEEDAKEFKGFPTADSKKVQIKKDGSIPLGKSKKIAKKAPRYPVFALLYKFRKEYLEGGGEVALGDQQNLLKDFKRLINCEILQFSKPRRAKGAVLLWAGFTENDHDETKAEIMSFLEQDPLMKKDIVETWDLINLTGKEHLLPVGGESAKEEAVVSA